MARGRETELFFFLKTTTVAKHILVLHAVGQRAWADSLKEPVRYVSECTCDSSVNRRTD